MSIRSLPGNGAWASPKYELIEVSSGGPDPIGDALSHPEDVHTTLYPPESSKNLMYKLTNHSVPLMVLSSR